MLPGIWGHTASKLHKRHAHVHAARGVALRILEFLRQETLFTSLPILQSSDCLCHVQDQLRRSKPAQPRLQVTILILPFDEMVPSLRTGLKYELQGYHVDITCNC